MSKITEYTFHWVPLPYSHSVAVCHQNDLLALKYMFVSTSNNMCGGFYLSPFIRFIFSWTGPFETDGSGATVSVFLCTVHVSIYTMRTVSDFNLFKRFKQFAHSPLFLFSCAMLCFTHITSRCSHAIDKIVYVQWISCFWSYAHIRPLIITRQSISLSAVFVRVNFFSFSLALHPFHFFCTGKHISAIKAIANLWNVAIHLSTMMMTLMMVLIKSYWWQIHFPIPLKQLNMRERERRIKWEKTRTIWTVGKKRMYICYITSTAQVWIGCMLVFWMVNEACTNQVLHSSVKKWLLIH